jgi:hypothetical protein
VATISAGAAAAMAAGADAAASAPKNSHLGFFVIITTYPTDQQQLKQKS